jgi:hypothetical protein
MTERTIDAALRTMLINNEPFEYAHLIKFERPSLPDTSGRVSTSAQRYTYLTDGSVNVSFDDGSTDLNGASNGTQIYLANKVLKVSSITEETEAKASSFTIEIDGTALGASVSDVSVTTSVVSTGVYDIVFPAATDLILEGFREGDKVNLQGDGAFVDGYYNIVGFRTGNVLRVSKIDHTMTAGSFTVSMTLASEEIVSILADKTTDGYASFLNRRVFVYKAYFQNGAIVGAPVLLFKGLISNSTFDDDENKIRVSWGLTSHWGDWSQVAGRITSDDFHRALDESGNPSPESALKPIYAYDKGFAHSETSINLLAKYNVLVEKQTIKTKNGFFGIGSKVKVKKYLAPEERTSDLDFQLSAKSLGVHYGVRPVQGIPVFVDTLVADPSTIYLAYALGEGEINSIYDIYIDGNSLICNNESDFDSRGAQTADNTVPLICKGRADRGDVLGGIEAGYTSPTSFYSGDSYLFDFGYNILAEYNYLDYIAPAEAAAGQTGILDGETLVLSSPQEISLDFFSGKTGQKAARSLVNLAASNGFKIQNDYWSGTDTAEYWGPNHRLIDTAYVVAKFKIAEGETTVPDLEFILKGKVVDCYNYDYSYSKYAKAAGENADNFKLGATVELRRSDTTAVINASVQIIDKWTFYNPDGSANVRFRFSAPPELGYVNGVPSITKFYMKSGANTWTMVTYNHQEHAGTVSAQISSPVNSVTNSGGKVRFDYTSNVNLTYGGDPQEPSAKYAITKSDLTPVTNEIFGTAILAGTDSSTQLLTSLDHSSLGAYASAATGGGNLIVSRNTIKLAAGASSVDDYYNGYTIVVSSFNSSTGRQLVQRKTVLDYDGANKVATIDDVWDPNGIPTTSTTYYLEQPYIDSRATINFAAITVDYVSSTTYGRGLVIGEDINLPSALQAMRDCDERSDVTVRTSSVTVTPTAGAVYKFSNTAGDILWQGTVLSTFVSDVSGSSKTYVTFTDIIGKLTNYWKSWKVYPEGTLVHYGNNLYKATGSYVANSTAPTHTSGTVNQLAYQGSLSLTRVSGTGDASLALFVAGNPVQSVKNGRVAGGYSLYDCDEVDYWRYVGWDACEQRYVTKFQGNITIDTSQPVFENTNGLLQHYGGMFRYNAGQYFLEVEAAAEAIDADDPANITEDSIVGKIKINDEGIRGAFNSLAVSYADPSNRYESRTISFFNSEYLKIDRNVPRKGNLSIPGVTNYYNARLLADSYLNKSRFGTSISLTLVPKCLTLLPGNVVQIQQPRYGWTDKKFRITSLVISEDSLIDITAKEYDASFYSASNIRKQSGSGLAGLPVINTISAPSALTATEFDDSDASAATIALNWSNSSASNAATTLTELYHFSNTATGTGVSTNVITTSAAHGFTVGDIVVAFNTGNGLTAGNIYYVLTTPLTTTLTLSTSLGGTTLSLTNGSGLTLGLGKQELLTTVNCPGNSYSDVTYTTAQLNKYYRIRHKQAVQQNGGPIDQYSGYHPTSTGVLGSTVVVVSIPSTGDIDLGTADNSLHLSGTNTEILAHFGSASPTNAPTKVTTSGTLISRDFEQRSADNTLKWSSSTGHTQSGLNDIFANLTNQLPTAAIASDSVTNATTVSGTTDPGAAKRVTYRLGGDSDVTIQATCTISGISYLIDNFGNFTYTVYERYSSSGDFSSSSWSSIGTDTIVKGTDYAVSTISVPVWNFGDGFYASEEVYSVSPTIISISVGLASKAAGYYQYAVVGPTTYPWGVESYSSTVTATDVDTIPSYILAGNGVDSVNFIHPIGVYSNIKGVALGGVISYTADMVVLSTVDGLPRTARNFNAYNLGVTLTGATDTVSTVSAHGLTVNQKVVATANAAGFSILSGYSYYVKTIPSDTTFTLSSTPGGSTLDLAADDTTTFTICINDLNLGISGVGGLDTGTKANSTWYYIWLISNGIVDRLLASTSSSAPTMPSGYSYKKLIGACKTSSSGDVLSYKQVNDKIQFILSPGTYNGLEEIVGTVLNAGDQSNNSWAPSATLVRGTTSFVPPLANTIEVQLTTRGNVVLQVAPNSSYNGYLGTLPAPLVTYGHAQNITGSLILESDNLYMSCDNTAGSIYCLGYNIDI